MATKATVEHGTITSVYDDRWAPILLALGDVTITRATDVEYAAGWWCATHRESGTIIATGTNRAEVISAEVEWLEDRLDYEPRSEGQGEN